MPDRPNILFVLSDQQRWDTVSCYGEPLGAELDLTPHLDQMAKRGTRFNNAFTMQPVCGPARACLQTGQYASQNGCVTNNVPLPPDANTIAKQLNAGGYRTGYIGKWHLASGGEHGNFQTKAVPEQYRGGYKDHWLAADVLEFTSSGYEGYMFDGENRRVDFEGYRVDATANYVIDFLRGEATANRDEPFFLMASFIEPHHQNDLDRYIGPIGSKSRFANYNVPGDLLGTKPEPGRRCDWPLHMPDYLGCCWSLSQNMGRIRTTLEMLGLAENTVVIYTSDHGSHFCTRNSEYKRSCHDGCTHIPMIIEGPGFDGGGVIDAFSSLIDIPRTILTAAGVAPDPAMQGRALQDVVGGAPDDWPDDVFIQISESQTGRAVRTHKWKYCVDAPDTDRHARSSPRYVEQYLYDLEADPHERNNLVSDPAYKAARGEMEQRLRARMKAVREADFTLEPAAG